MLLNAGNRYTRPATAARHRHGFRGRTAVKDMIEALGVPHTEVDLVLVNGRFWLCAGCGRIYWQGSHYERLRQLIRELLGSGPGG